jgi:Mg2+-importing ATPase
VLFRSTQILVIFVIRTHGPFWRRWPHPVLAASSIGALVVAVAAALGPLGPLVGFRPLGADLLLTIAGLVVGYFGCAEAVKRFAAGRRDRRDTGARRAD